MNQRRGFTLVELLAVIAILGLLFSVLLPALTKAREAAKGTSCLSNLRQISHGWHLYADENDDVSVPGRYAKAPGGKSNPKNWYEIGNGLKYRPRWMATMGKQVGLFAFAEPKTDDDRQDYDGEVFRCPTASERLDERNHAFGYNHQFLGNARKTNGRFHNFPVNRSRIRSFAGTVLAADCLGTAAGFATLDREEYNNNGTGYAELSNHAWSLDPPKLTETSDRGSGDADSPRTAVDVRHGGRSNVIYCDGHGETQTAKELGYRILSGGAFVDLEEVENAPTNRLFSGTGRDDDPPDLPK